MRAYAAFAGATRPCTCARVLSTLDPQEAMREREKTNYLRLLRSMPLSELTREPSPGGEGAERSEADEV